MMTLPQSFEVGSYACYYDKSPPENHVGEVIKVEEDGLSIRLPDGTEKKFSQEESEKMVESAQPNPENTMGGLPTDPEVWDTHHQLVFTQRELHNLRERENAARIELAELLQCPATWAFILPKIKELKAENDHAQDILSKL